MVENVTVREACRKRMSLDGADAQALEHALTQAEQEIKHIEQQIEHCIECKKVAKDAGFPIKPCSPSCEWNPAIEEKKCPHCGVVAKEIRLVQRRMVLQRLQSINKG
jgi:hypothetical protein